MTTPRSPLNEDELRRQLASAAGLIDPQPPTRAELEKLRQRRRRVLRIAGPPLFVAAAVAGIAAVSVAVAVHHDSQPRLPAATRPDPYPTVSSTSVIPTATTPIATTTSQKASTGSSSRSESHSTPPTDATGLPLVLSAYGFRVPRDWHEHPLTNYGGSGSWASFTEGSAAAPLHAAMPLSVQFTESAAQGTLYTKDGRAILSEAANATLCAPTSWQAISPSAISFSCAPVSGMVPRGVLIVGTPPGPTGGTRQLIVTLPASQQATVTRILDSFH